MHWREPFLSTPEASPPRSESLPSGEAIRRASTARLLVAITFHCRDSRLEFLHQVLCALREFPVSRIRVILVTNASDEATLDRLGRLGGDLFGPADFSVEVFPDHADPFDLTWCHKDILARDWTATGADFTHFVYLEDDIRLSFVNFCYWIDGREALRPHGLLPAFFRTEFHGGDATATCSDAFWPVYVPFQAGVDVRGHRFFNMPNPYNPLYVLDADLVAEHMNSASFGRESSAAVAQWGNAERAAMGLCLEEIPPGFASRYVVPAGAHGRVPACAWVSHLPNNYAGNPFSPLGKVRLATLAAGVPHTGGQANPWRAAEELIGLARSVDPQTLFYLVTEHDTVVHFDPGGQELRHGPLGIAPLHTCAELLDDRVRLWVGAVDGRDPPDDARRWVSPLDFRLEWFFDGTVALVADGNYLRASIDGSARNDRQVCLEWERFRLIRVDTLAGLSLLRRCRWTHDASGTLFPPLADQPLLLDYPGRDHSATEASALAAPLPPHARTHRQGLKFGPLCLQPIGSVPIIRARNDAGEASFVRPASLEVLDGDGHWVGFSIAR